MTEVSKSSIRVDEKLVWATALVAAAVWLVCPSAKAETITMRISSVYSDQVPEVQGLYAMERYIEEALPNEIDVQIYPSSQLVSQSREVSALRRGGLEGMVSGLQRFASNVPQASLWGAAYLNRDIDHACTLYNTEFGKNLVKSIEEKLGFKALAKSYVGTRNIGLREVHDAKTPEDLNGLKIRVPGIKAWQTLAYALGGKPETISFGEIYLAMQTGTVDAYEAELSTMIDSGLSEVTKEVVLDNHVLLTFVLWTSQDFWSKLSEKQQKIVLEGAREFSRVASEGRLELEAIALDKLKAAGIKITTPDVDAFRRYARTVYAESELAEDWPAGMYEQLSTLPADPNCRLY